MCVSHVLAFPERVPGAPRWGLEAVGPIPGPAKQGLHGSGQGCCVGVTSAAACEMRAACVSSTTWDHKGLRVRSWNTVSCPPSGSGSGGMAGLIFSCPQTGSSPLKGRVTLGKWLNLSELP